MALNPNLQLLLFAMSYSVLNDLAEAMKALDGKRLVCRTVQCELRAEWLVSPLRLCCVFVSGLGVLFLVLVAVD